MDKATILRELIDLKERGLLTDEEFELQKLNILNGPNAALGSAEDRVPCPVCKELIKRGAAKCRFCGEILSGSAINSSFINQPSAALAKAVKAGRQRSKLRNDLGHAIAFIGLPIAVVIGMASGILAGWLTAMVVMGIAVWVAYGS